MEEALLRRVASRYATDRGALITRFPEELALSCISIGKQNYG